MHLGQQTGWSALVTKKLHTMTYEQLFCDTAVNALNQALKARGLAPDDFDQPMPAVAVWTFSSSCHVAWNTEKFEFCLTGPDGGNSHYLFEFSVEQAGTIGDMLKAMSQHY
jgi:hypothetical protein